MAEYHYVVSFNSDTKKWKVEQEWEYLLDGNIWDDTTECWLEPNDDELANSEFIDEKCRNMLNALVPIWPAVDTTPYP